MMNKQTDDQLANEKLDQICKLLNEVYKLNFHMSRKVINKLENVKDWSKILLND